LDFILRQNWVQYDPMVLTGAYQGMGRILFRRSTPNQKETCNQPQSMVRTEGSPPRHLYDRSLSPPGGGAAWRASPVKSAAVGLRTGGGFWSGRHPGRNPEGAGRQREGAKWVGARGGGAMLLQWPQFSPDSAREKWGQSCPGPQGLAPQTAPLPTQTLGSAPHARSPPRIPMMLAARGYRETVSVCGGGPVSVRGSGSTGGLFPRFQERPLTGFRGSDRRHSGATMPSPFTQSLKFAFFATFSNAFPPNARLHQEPVFMHGGDDALIRICMRPFRLP